MIKKFLLLIIFIQLSAVLKGQEHVLIRELNSYESLTEYSEEAIQNHPLAGVLVSFTGVITSNPRSSGLSATRDNDGDGVNDSISRIHVFITDTSAASLGRDGMSIQLVENDYLILDSLKVGDVATFTGSLVFFGAQSQMTVESLNYLGSTDAEFPEYSDLLEPRLVTIDELNTLNDDGTIEIKIENYSKYNASYVRLSYVQKIDVESINTSRPDWGVSANSSKIYTYDHSLRFRNDRTEYLPGYNYRRSEDGEFSPPVEGSVLNLNGFITLVNNDPGLDVSEGKRAFSISPFEDGILWQDSVRQVNGESYNGEIFSWPNDLELIGIAPHAPELNAELIDSTVIELTWVVDDPENISGFILYRGTQSNPELDTLTVFGNDIFLYSDSNLELDAIYTYGIQAFNDIDLNSAINTVQIPTADSEAPAKPVLLGAETGHQTITLNWQNNTEEDLAGYNIYRSLDSLSFDLINQVSLELTTYTDSLITINRDYYYRITAIDTENGEFDSALESQFSNTIKGIARDFIPPGKPIIISTTSVNSSVSFDWQNLNDGDLSRYIIYRGLIETNIEKFDSVSSEVVTYTDNDVQNGETYYYRVSGVDSVNNEGELSDLIVGNPANIGPFAVQISDIVQHGIQDSTFTIELSADNSFDSDGQIDSTIWLIGDKKISEEFSFTYQAPQGTTELSLTVVDNNGARDTKSFKVSISAEYRSFTSGNSDAAGVSLLGSDYFFIPLAGGIMQILDGDFDDRFDLAVGGEIRSVSSVSSDTTVYLASTDRVVYSFDRRGIPLWNSPLGGELQATPTIDTQRNLIYVGVSNSNLFAVNRNTGDVEWSYRLENPLTQPGVIVNGRYLLVVTEEGEASYFDLDGSVSNQELPPIGSIVINDQIASAPAIDNEYFIYVSTTSGKLIKLEFREDLPNFGQIIWETEVAANFDASPVVGYDGTVYVGGNSSTFYAFDSDNGSLKWQFQTLGAVTTTATINEFGVIYLGDETGRIYAIDEFGSQIWYYEAGKPIGNATAYVDGNFIFATQDGELYKIYDGWRFETQAKLVAKGKLVSKVPQWGTYQGNFRRSGNQNETSVVANESLADVPTNYSISQNYPNPFNPNTQINFELPEDSRVSLKVFDLLGREVATLVQDQKQAGYHSVNFDASSLSSGVYFYTIKADDFLQTKKMLLIK